MFLPEDILFEDNHILIVNKRSGDLVQPDPSGSSALENEIKEFLKVRDSKPGEVFLGVVHRVDRPVSGTVLFAKTSKALVRLNEMIKERAIKKTYWAIVEKTPVEESGVLINHIIRDSSTNKSRIIPSPRGESKEAKLAYRVLAHSDRYHLLEVDLLTGRHHQIRCQLAGIGCHIRGDLKYGASRSLPGGGINLHARSLEFVHPVGKEDKQIIKVAAPPPASERLWAAFDTEK